MHLQLRQLILVDFDLSEPLETLKLGLSAVGAVIDHSLVNGYDLLKFLYFVIRTLVLEPTLRPKPCHGLFMDLGFAEPPTGLVLGPALVDDLPCLLLEEPDLRF
jgi:hypothetical protein